MMSSVAGNKGSARLGYVGHGGHVVEQLADDEVLALLGQAQYLGLLARHHGARRLERAVVVRIGLDDKGAAGAATTVSARSTTHMLDERIAAAATCCRRGSGGWHVVEQEVGLVVAVRHGERGERRRRRPVDAARVDAVGDRCVLDKWRLDHRVQVDERMQRELVERHAANARVEHIGVGIRCFRRRRDRLVWRAVISEGSRRCAVDSCVDSDRLHDSGCGGGGKTIG